MQAGDMIHGGTQASFATPDKRHVSRDRTRMLAESAESLLDRIQRLPARTSASTVAAGLESSARCQWMVDLTYYVVKCAFVGIALVHERARTLEPLAEAGQPQEDRRQWWAYLWGALFGEHAALEGAERQMESPIVVRLPPRRPGSPGQARRARTLCAVPMSVSGCLTAIFAVEIAGASRTVPADVMTLVRAMASAAAPTLDVHDHRRAQLVQQVRALRETLNEMDSALCLASHELKSPLTTIIGCLQLIMPKMERLTVLTSDFPDVEKSIATIQHLLTLASRNAQIEDRIATDLVNASRIHNARIPLLPRPCDLGQIVQESIGAQRAASPRRLIHLAVPARSIPVSADPDRITQVITNFLGNAVKYSPKEAPVEVWVEVRKRSARVSVRDFGPGLEPSEFTRIWERFYRVGGVPPNSATGSGLGLGLYIGREIVREHRGRVGVTSAPGHGATFWFTLPLATSV